MFSPLNLTIGQFIIFKLTTKLVLLNIILLHLYDRQHIKICFSFKVTTFSVFC